MENNNNENEQEGYREQKEVYSNCVRAGRHTYFFDVRKTRNNDYYLTITESKRKYSDEGEISYQKNKIFIYKKDFENFGKALTETFQKVVELNQQKDKKVTKEISKDFTDINFEDLDN